MTNHVVPINRDRNRSIGPEWIWPDMTIGVNAISDEILTLTRLRHTLSSNREIVQIKML